MKSISKRSENFEVRLQQSLHKLSYFEKYDIKQISDDREECNCTVNTVNVSKAIPKPGIY